MKNKGVQISVAKWDRFFHPVKIAHNTISSPLLLISKDVGLFLQKNRSRRDIPMTAGDIRKLTAVGGSEVMKRLGHVCDVIVFSAL